MPTAPSPRTPAWAIRGLYPQRRHPGIGGTPKTVIFLTADAYGVMPPISKLNAKQAQYYFVSGFTSKLAGTERGITSPVPTFSTCFGAPFMPLDPSVYAEMLEKKVQQSGANVYLVNTGWCGNSGKRMNLKYTRAMVTAALNGELEKAQFVTDPYFGVQVPHLLPRRARRADDSRQAVGRRPGRL